MCGRDNPDHLVFCQECGQRLAPAPRTAPVAASAGGPPPTSPLAATAASPVAQMPSSLPSSKVRPPAPEVSFSKRREGEATGDPAAPLEQTPRGVTCVLCGTANQLGLRFCITCGQVLTRPDPVGTDRIGAIELMRTVVDLPAADNAQGPPAPAPPIAPARVIDLGVPPSRVDQRFCPRCRGACDASAQFCRFCGLPLVATTPTNTPGGAWSATPFDGTSVRIDDSTKEVVTFRGVAADAPALPLAHSRLVLIARDGTEGPSYPLDASTDIGRTEGQILFSDDPYISPRHARVVARGAAFFLVDLESTNGIFMRVPFSAGSSDGDDETDDKITIRGHHGEAVPESRSEQPLGDQELFLVGQQVLRFEVVKHAEEAFGAASENGTLLFGTPAAPRHARLSQRTVEGVTRDVFHVRRAETVIGRESGDIVFTDDPFLSRRHALLRMHATGGQKRRFTLTDLGSSNGTFLRIQGEVRLHHGYHFRIGQQLLRFDIDAAHTGV
jgi:pSer/pThr/pTyr-binding forkhead associated (FHA) protein